MNLGLPVLNDASIPTSNWLKGIFNNTLELIKEGYTTPEKVSSLIKLNESQFMADERIPSLRVPVSMLYVPVTINDHYITAFVDSGAQVSIMNYETAVRCGLEPLIDRRYASKMRGVISEGETIGRIHYAKVQVGGGEYECGFTVLAKGANMMIGLDIMRLHQCEISLLKNQMTFGAGGYVKVDFLPQKEVFDGSGMFGGDNKESDNPSTTAPSEGIPAEPPITPTGNLAEPITAMAESNDFL